MKAVASAQHPPVRPVVGTEDNEYNDKSNVSLDKIRESTRCSPNS